MDSTSYPYLFKHSTPTEREEEYLFSGEQMSYNKRNRILLTQVEYRNRRTPKQFLKNSIIAGMLMGGIWAFLNSYFHPSNGLLAIYNRTDTFIIQTVVQGAFFVFLGMVVGIAYGMCLDLSYYKMGRIKNHYLRILAITGLLWIGTITIVSIFFFELVNIFSSIVLAMFLFLFITLRTRKD